MKPIVAGLAGIVGIAWLKRRRKPAAPDPADELKAKLAQAREADDRAEFESGEQPVDQVPDAAGSVGGEAADARPENPAAFGDGGVDSRRRDVHDRARAAIDELSSDS